VHAVGCEAEWEVMVVEVDWGMVRWLEDAERAEAVAFRRIVGGL